MEHMKLLESDGQLIKVLDRDGVIALEPALASAKDKIAGGIYCPTDETGDPAKFTRALAAKVVERGGDDPYGHDDHRRSRRPATAITQVLTDTGSFKGDAYVLALGTYSADMARTIGISLPIYPIKGYSLTIPIGNRPLPPTIASVDEHNLVAISRFGDRVRVTATAEFAGYDTSHKPADFAFMTKVTQELYPEGADYDRAEMWAGLRPMTPTNLPFFGRQRYPQSLPQYRPRPYRLDHVAWLGPDHGRPDRRPHARHSHGRPAGRLTPEEDLMSLAAASPSYSEPSTSACCPRNSTAALPRARRSACWCWPPTRPWSMSSARW